VRVFVQPAIQSVCCLFAAAGADLVEQRYEQVMRGAVKFLWIALETPGHP
jgi:hypothetical protein